jgi:hypothetical protein
MSELLLAFQLHPKLTRINVTYFFIADWLRVDFDFKHFWFRFFNNFGFNNFNRSVINFWLDLNAQSPFAVLAIHEQPVAS